MHIVIDYRQAVHERTPVGEYVREVCTAIARDYPEHRLTLIASSRQTRSAEAIARAVPSVRFIDQKLPGAVLDYAWRTLEWPTIERLTGETCDVAFSPHPLLLPSRAPQVVMIYDLPRLREPAASLHQMGRNDPRLVRHHARRAAAVVVPSAHIAGEVMQRLEIDPKQVAICPPGAPVWCDDVGIRAVAPGHILCIGTSVPHRNLEAVLEVYARLIERQSEPPRLIVAGSVPRASMHLVERTRTVPFAGRVQWPGDVPPESRPVLFAGARVVALLGNDDGFGRPALEAMSMGIPVVASRRGGLRDLVGDAGVLVDPDDYETAAAALDRICTDDDFAERLGARGVERAKSYRWSHTAARLVAAFEDVCQRAEALLPDRAGVGVG